MVYYMNRNRYKQEFKAKVALAAVKGDKTVNELAPEYDIHPTQINQWKRQALGVTAGGVW